jgi:hypothetical protein
VHWCRLTGLWLPQGKARASADGDFAVSFVQVSSKYGYPVARRVIVGALLKQRVEHGRFSRPVQQLVDKILLQLFQLHKKSTASKGAIQFFHISKSGGTNLCQSAQTNGCNTEVRGAEGTWRRPSRMHAAPFVYSVRHSYSHAQLQPLSQPARILTLPAAIVCQLQSIPC